MVKNYTIYTISKGFFWIWFSLNCGLFIAICKWLNKFKIGDIAYIYVSKPIQSIAIKTEVSKIDIPKDEILGNDEKYFLNHNIDDRESFVRLKFLEFTNQDNLSLQNLQENGLKQAPQS